MAFTASVILLSIFIFRYLIIYNMRGKGTKILWEKQEKKPKIGETRQVKRKLA